MSIIKDLQADKMHRKLIEVSLRKAVRTYANRATSGIEGDDEAWDKGQKTYDRIEKKWGDKGTKLATRAANRQTFGHSHGIMAHHPEKKLETKSEKKRNAALRKKAVKNQVSVDKLKKFGIRSSAASQKLT